ncbi:hypothetical protein NQZ79_g2277 [Umbelopsis isabellina]|nr:hypothetical protein NQZ79_g2277 [Umbelopsis isabellina]
MKRYLRESEFGRYKELDEATVTPSRKGRVTTSHEPNINYKGDSGNRQVHIPEYQDYIYYMRSGSQAEGGYLRKSKKKPNLDINDEHIIYKERLQEPDVDTNVKEVFEKPKKVHFQMRESKSTPLGVSLKAIKQKHGSKTSRYYTSLPHQKDQNKERYGGHTPDLEGDISSNEEDTEYFKHLNAKSLYDSRLHTRQHSKTARSELQHQVEFSDSDNFSESEPDLDFYNKPSRSRRPQTPGKTTLYTFVPDKQATNYNHIPSRIPRPSSAMPGPQKSAVKKSSSFDSRPEFSVSRASMPHNISKNEKLQKRFEEESIHLERLFSSGSIRSQAKHNRRYATSNLDSPKKPVKYTLSIEDFKSESLDGISTDESDPDEFIHGSSQSRIGSPVNHDSCYPTETSESDSDEVFEQIEVYVPTAVFKHASRQIYDHDQDYLRNHSHSYKSQPDRISRMPIVIDRPESRSNDHNNIRKREKDQTKDSRHRYKVSTSKGRKQMEEMDDGLMKGRRHCRQPNSQRNASVETSRSHKKLEIDAANTKLLRKAEDSHRMFMSVWLPPRTSNGGLAKPKRSVLDTPEHLFMLRRIVKRT